MEIEGLKECIEKAKEEMVASETNIQELQQKVNFLLIQLFKAVNLMNAIISAA